MLAGFRAGTRVRSGTAVAMVLGGSYGGGRGISVHPLHKSARARDLTAKCVQGLPEAKVIKSAAVVSTVTAPTTPPSGSVTPAASSTAAEVSSYPPNPEL